MLTEDFLAHFLIDGQYMTLAGGSVKNTIYVKELNNLVVGDKDCYFSPAQRKTTGDLKEDVGSSRVLWVDVDNPMRPQTTLPPSFTVFSGHGWHLYWVLEGVLDDTDVIETYNKILIKDTTGADPACWNCNRLMRVPGSMNVKEPGAGILCEVKDEHSPGFKYLPADLETLSRLDGATRHKIRTGDRRGYRSRSERDWAITIALLRAGGRDELIERIFANQPCGDKSTTEGGYLARTIESAKASIAKQPAADKTGAGGAKEKGTRVPSPAVITEQEDGYYVVGRSAKRVSTFLLEPTLLLDGSQEHTEDSIVTNVKAEGYEWKNVTFSRGAFNSVMKIDRETPVAAWQWLGRDEDVRMLLPFLMAKLKEKGLPRVMGTPTMGLHFIKGVPHFVTDDQVMSPDGRWEGYTGPIGWIPSKGEHPCLQIIEGTTDQQKTMLGLYLPRLNEPEVIWPMLGWYAASALKPWLEQQGYRFPILNVTGTRGSGKTTLIQRVLMPLFGQPEPKSYDAGTTRFVMLSCLGATNAVPVSFSEFRYDSVEKFLRYILLAYDTGHDPRGRSDQSTVDYALSAPFSIDGEDLVSDPAARERIVVASLRPNTVREGGECYTSFNLLRANGVPDCFCGDHIRYTLQGISSGVLKTQLKEARDATFAAFPMTLPDRVRNNHIVVLLGAWMVCDQLGIPRIPAGVMRRSINTIYNLDTKRSRTLVDDFVEEMINSLPNSNFQYTASGGVYYFQMAPAHSWWQLQRRRTGKASLERDAIMNQLKESDYFTAGAFRDGTYMYGIDVVKANKAGLDIPVEVNTRKITVSF